nr:MAG TPA: minor tail protein [Caudoviricetes sp.]
MAGVDLGSIVAHLRLEMNDFNSGLNDAVNRIRETQQQFEGLSSFGKSLSTVGAGLTASITAPVMALGASVVQTQMKFQDSMAKVKALSGATGEDFKMLEDTAKKFGESTVFSASECADALGYMALAGWDAQQSADGLPGVLNLAAASGMELAQASDLVTDYLTAFGLEADQAGRMADVLSYAQANSNTTTEMLGEAFKNCAVNAHNAGMSLEETTAILGRFADAGLKGSEGGTALNAIIRDMTQKMKNGAIQIGNTSVKVQDANGNFRSMTDIIRDVDNATKGMGDAQRTAALMTTFTADSIKGMGILCNTGADNIDKFTKELENSDGTAEDMANTLSSTLSGALKQLSSAWEGLQYDLGDTTGVLTKIVNGLTLLVRWLKSLPGPVKQIIVTLALLAATIGPTLLIIGKMIQAWVKMKETIGILKSGFGLLRGVLSGLPSVFGIIQGVVSTVGGALSSLWAVLMANPIILVIAGITALVAAFIYFWNTSESFRQFWIDLWETIKTAAVNAWNAIGTFFTTTVPQWISNIGNWFSQLPSNIAYWLGYALGTVASWVVNLATKGYEAGRDFVTKAVEFIKTLPAKIFTWLVNTIARVETWKVQMYQKSIQAGLQFIQGVIQFIQTLPSRVGTWLTSTISRVATWASQMASRAYQAGSQFVSRCVSAVQQLPGRLFSIGSNAIHSLISGLMSGVGSLWNACASIASRAVAGFKAAFKIGSPSKIMRDEVGRWIPEGISIGISENAKNTLATIQDFSRSLIDEFGRNNYLKKVNFATSGININTDNSSDSNTANLLRQLTQTLQENKPTIDYDKMGEVYRKANAQTNTQIFMDKTKVGVAVASSVKERNDYLQNQQDRFRGDKDYV